MAKINLKFSELHTPMFLAGVSLGNKLDTAKRSDLKLVYDRDQKELIVFFKGQVAILPSSNVVSMTPYNAQDVGVDFDTVESPKPEPQKVVPHKPIKAQVSDPVRDKVFGPGN